MLKPHLAGCQEGRHIRWQLNNSLFGAIVQPRPLRQTWLVAVTSEGNRVDCCCFAAFFHKRGASCRPKRLLSNRFGHFQNNLCLLGGDIETTHIKRTAVSGVTRSFVRLGRGFMHNLGLRYLNHRLDATRNIVECILKVG